MALSKKRRFEIFKRDRFRCQYCGASPPSVILQVDHVVAVSNGGSDDEGNLVTSCRDCNSGKSNRMLDTPPSMAEQIADKAERVEQLRVYNKLLAAERKSSGESVNAVLGRWKENTGRDLDLQKVSSIRLFAAKLPVETLLRAVDITFSKLRYHGYDSKHFQYFCGVCWKIIKGARDE